MSQWVYCYYTQRSLNFLDPCPTARPSGHSTSWRWVEIRVQIVVPRLGALRGEVRVVLVYETSGRVLGLVPADVGMGRGQWEQLHVVGGGVALAPIVAAVQREGGEGEKGGREGRERREGGRGGREGREGEKGGREGRERREGGREGRERREERVHITPFYHSKFQPKLSMVELHLSHFF